MSMAIAATNHFYHHILRNIRYLDKNVSIRFKLWTASFFHEAKTTSYATI